MPLGSRFNPDPTGEYGRFSARPGSDANIGLLSVSSRTSLPRHRATRDPDPAAAGSVAFRTIAACARCRRFSVAARLTSTSLARANASSGACGGLLLCGRRCLGLGRRVSGRQLYALLGPQPLTRQPGVEMTFCACGRSETGRRNGRAGEECWRRSVLPAPLREQWEAAGCRGRLGAQPDLASEPTPNPAAPPPSTTAAASTARAAAPAQNASPPAAPSPRRPLRRPHWYRVARRRKTSFPHRLPRQRLRPQRPRKQPAAPAPSEPKTSPPAQKTGRQFARDAVHCQGQGCRRQARRNGEAACRAAPTMVREAAAAAAPGTGTARGRGTRCGKKPKAGRYWPSSRLAPSSRASGYSIWTDPFSRA